MSESIIQQTCLSRATPSLLIKQINTEALNQKEKGNDPKTAGDTASSSAARNIKAREVCIYGWVLVSGHDYDDDDDDE